MKHIEIKRWRTKRAAIAGAIAALVAVVGINGVSAVEPAERRYSLFAEGDANGALVDPDVRPVELGVRFESAAAGKVSAVKFLKAPGDVDTHSVSIWDSNGTRLAEATSSNESPSGWQSVQLPEPVAVSAKKTYVVSYHTTRYMATTGWFEKATASGPLQAPAGDNGVYAYGTSPTFPTETWNASNYWVDVVFESKGSASGTTTTTFKPGTSSTTAPPTTTTTPPTTPPGSGPSGSLNLPRVPWEGGPSYYAQFSNAKQLNDRDFFPIGVWFESVLSADDANKDKAAGINTYVQLTDNTDMSHVRDAGMYALFGGGGNAGSETVGHNLGDEADMLFGAGSDVWNGNWTWDNGCSPSQENGGKCGYTFMQTQEDRVPAGMLKYSNYGKGVMFWQSDEEAGKFVNDYTDVVSNDIYWYTDPNVCYSASEGATLGVTADNCRRAANYGLTMDRMRELDGKDSKRQPVYAFVEDGHPFTENDAPTITGPQIKGAVMNSLIHEARGIIYFNHNFGGSCISQHVLRDACGAGIRPDVTEVNSQIRNLAPVLNTQSYQWTFNPNVDTMLKEHDGSYYVFAMPSRTGGTGSQSLTLPSGINASKAEVLFENRTVDVSGGRLTDSFPAEYSYHVYKITP